MKSKNINVILILIVLAGGVFRVLEVPVRSLEYDEIWTMKNYFQCTFTEIFTKLETPNNHPLHTLFARTVCGIAGNEYWALRLPALSAGLLLLFGALYVGKQYLRSKYAQIVFAASVAFSPYLVHYSNTARGYSMQAFFIFAMVFLLFEYARKPSIVKGFGIFAAAAAALFTVYSGLIFICAAAGAYMFAFFDWRNWKSELKKNLFLFAAGADFFIIAALWLGLNWEKIAKAQQFGTKISSITQFFQSAGHLVYDLNLSLPLIIVIAALVLRPKDKILRFGMTFAVLTFLSIFATKCGPERVYVPMIAVVLFGAARGLEVIAARFYKIRYIELILTVVLCLPLFFIQNCIERISPPDWRYFVTQIEKNIPGDCYTVYPAGDTYPIYFNHPEAAEKIVEKSKKDLAVIGFISPQNDRISCIAEDNSEKSLPLLPNANEIKLAKNYKMMMYHLIPLEKAFYHKKMPVIAFFVEMPKRQYMIVRNILYSHDDCYLLNAFFGRERGVQKLRSIPYFIPEASQDYEYYARMSGSRLKFYILKSAGK